LGSRRIALLARLTGYRSGPISAQIAGAVLDGKAEFAGTKGIRLDLPRAKTADSRLGAPAAGVSRTQTGGPPDAGEQLRLRILLTGEDASVMATRVGLVTIIQFSPGEACS